MEKYKVKNKRLSKYLYSLGFDREIITEAGEEHWNFELNDNLKESLDFYFYMRDKNR